MKQQASNKTTTATIKISKINRKQREYIRRQQKREEKQMSTVRTKNVDVGCRHKVSHECYYQ